jgi:hypothetical protein
MRRIRSHVTFANAVSMIALFVALGRGHGGCTERLEHRPVRRPRSRRSGEGS